MLAKKTKARRKGGREVTNSCLSCFETLTCILKSSSSVLCNTTRCGFVFGYLTHWEYAVRVCVFACIVLTNSPISWEVMYDPDHTLIKGETSRTPSSRGSGGLLVVRVVTWLQINMVVSQPLSPIISHLCYVTHSHICFQTLFCVFKHWYAFCSLVF